MSIEFRCTTCGRLLRVSDEHAGQIARCPKCETDLTVPRQTQLSDLAPREAEPKTTPESASTVDSGRPWYIHLPSGQRDGPMTRAELDRRMAEGKLTRNCQVLQEGWDKWKWADEIFPALANAGLRLPAGSSPYVSPSGSASMNAYLKPHRGGLILTLGILSLVTCPCGIFSLIGMALSIPAWVMANADLREMREGGMDPSGEGQTSAGRILAILHIVLYCVIMLAYVGFIGVMIVMEEVK